MPSQAMQDAIDALRDRQKASASQPPPTQDLAGFVGDFVAEPTTLPWGNRSLLLRDPDGNLVSFFTPHPGRHRKVRSLTTSQPPAGASGQKPRDPRDPRPLGDPGGLATVDG